PNSMNIWFHECERISRVFSSSFRKVQEMSDSPQAGRRSTAGWGVLLIALCVESFLMVWVLLITVLAALGSSGSFGQDLSLVAMALICLVWIVITLVGTVRSKASWVRG